MHTDPPSTYSRIRAVTGGHLTLFQLKLGHHFGNLFLCMCCAGKRHHQIKHNKKGCLSNVTTLGGEVADYALNITACSPTPRFEILSTALHVFMLANAPYPPNASKKIQILLSEKKKSLHVTTLASLQIIRIDSCVTSKHF